MLFLLAGPHSHAVSQRTDSDVANAPASHLPDVAPPSGAGSEAIPATDNAGSGGSNWLLSAWCAAPWWAGVFLESTSHRHVVRRSLLARLLGSRRWPPDMTLVLIAGMLGYSFINDAQQRK